MREEPVPLGFGPVLARARAVPESQRLFALLTIGVFSGGAGLFEFLRGLDWWWSLATAIVMFACLYVTNFKVSMRAGDGWFASNNGFLRTDRLTEVRARLITSGTHVSLRDADGRHIDVPLSELTDDAEIWKLVLAGIQVSKANGLLVDDNYTARVFGIARRPKENHAFQATAAVNE